MIVAFIGAFGSVIVIYNDDSSDYSYRYEIIDSLNTRGIHKDSLGEFLLNDAKVYSNKDSIAALDSLDIIEQKIRDKIVANHKAENNKRYWTWIPIGLIGGFLIGVFYLLLFGFGIRLVTNIRINKINQELLTKGAQELKDNIEKDFFTKLVEINFKYLDQYYLQTKEQADKSFLLCAFASSVGFIIIIIGIVMMFLDSAKIAPAYITTGAGVLSEFIASIFFYLYNRTVLKMSQYHQKLVITQNISLALKTADALKESKEKVLEIIIDRLTNDINKYLTNSSE